MSRNIRLKELDNLKWSPRWVSYLGCIQGCLDFLSKPISAAWLYGASGHAFVMNVTPDLCPSGPTDWNTEMITKLGQNIGYQCRIISGWKGKVNLRNLQETAWKHARKAIDKGDPCFGWELDLPEYYIIYGYDEEGYYISGPGCDDGKGPVPWKKPGTSPIGVLEIQSMEFKEAAEDEKTVFDSLSYALEYAHHPEPWINPRSSGGLRAYDTWIGSLEKGIAAAFGLAYNAVVWQECRKYAAGFLHEARDRLNRTDLDELFEEATNHYDVVSENLGKVCELYPFSQTLEMKPVRIDAVSRKAAEALRRAKESEISGLDVISRLVDKLQ
jgi:hypothetical protein